MWVSLGHVSWGGLSRCSSFHTEAATRDLITGGPDTAYHCKGQGSSLVTVLDALLFLFKNAAPQRAWVGAVGSLQAGPVCPSSSPESWHHFLFQPHELLPFCFSILSFLGSLCPSCWSEPGSVVAITSGHQHPWAAGWTPCQTPALPWDREEIARLARNPSAGNTAGSKGVWALMSFLNCSSELGTVTTREKLLVLAQGVGTRRICL